MGGEIIRPLEAVRADAAKTAQSLRSVKRLQMLTAATTFAACAGMKIAEYRTENAVLRDGLETANIYTALAGMSLFLFLMTREHAYKIKGLRLISEGEAASRDVGRSVTDAHLLEPGRSSGD